MESTKSAVLASKTIKLAKFTTLRKWSIWSLISAMPIALSACFYSNDNTQNKENIIDANTLLNPTFVRKDVKTSSTQNQSYSILIHRADKRLEVFDSQGVRLWNTAIGIGAGGLKEKKNMADLITPTGNLTVDLILYKKPEYNKIARNNVERFAKNALFSDFVTEQQGLAKLYKNMISLDFDGNGSPDRAYGDGYIGLTSNTVITGPKMSTFQGKPYWFSIALHGTPQPKNIGQANSGGCVHLDSTSLQQLIEKGWIKLGTSVKIIN
ncbi:MAG TPA: L,D-transpeptidase [Oculatellaceae cyanobacterium]|jgi:L,D-peptidoglycan transpeptidase YkuD (ErfK/YbiS/YcfS/YnhG family)